MVKANRNKEQVEASNKMLADTIGENTSNEETTFEQEQQAEPEPQKSPDQVAEEFAARVPESRRTVNISLVNSAEPWDFKESPEVFGTYTGETINFPVGHMRKNDKGVMEDVGGKPFAYIFKDDMGEKFSVPMSHLIDKAMNFDYLGTKVKDLKNPYIRIEWKGLKEKGNGQKFNDYDIQLLNFEE